MLGWLLAGMLLGAVVITICVSYLSVSVAKQKAREKCQDAVKLAIKDVVKSGSVTVVKMDALDEYGNHVNDISFEAEEISSDIYRGQKIYI